jgi:hypothetical protein
MGIVIKNKTLNERYSGGFLKYAYFIKSGQQLNQQKIDSGKGTYL